jgi:FkbM family methyltransferase
MQTNSTKFARLLRRVRPIELGATLKWLCGITYRETAIGARRFWLDPASDLGEMLLTDGYYELEVSALLVGLLQPGDTFVDVGANEGYFSLLASEKVGASGRVIAIEPQARLWPTIIQNMALNRRFNWTLVPSAIGECEGEVDLILYPSINTGASTLVKDGRKAHFARQRAMVMPLAAVFRACSVGPVAVMKIDIEGFELNALRSLGDFLSAGHVNHILVELHPKQLKSLGPSVEQVAEILTGAGYLKMSTTVVEHWQRRA